jgi:hypothetical protein
VSVEPFAVTEPLPGQQEATEVQIRQQGREHSLNAKGNFRFEREIGGWRSGSVVDLRRKR